MAELIEVVVGVVGRAHGIRGELTIVVRTDEPERRFAPGSQLRIEGSARTLTVATARDHSGRLLVGFAEVPDRTAAEQLRGAVLLVDVDPADRPVDAAEYFDRQLVGLIAYAPAGTVIGPVTSVLHLPGQDVLEIDGPSGTVLVPFVTALVPEVDLAAGRLTVADLAGLLDPDG